ncbi:dTDP-4-dehydrorhamnose reductase [Sphingobium phenoxybenzoativorans]|uniref:dTDP-4-dehydrorhamnose reductase n=1 Tax=Sphingobium phenoxybenzoativorans TaxID=1592790 RepID=UPI000872A717|nr:dTDP-4-dehydrorhamnose reductase [Sphingobium phenoxybenzoativorans]
MLDILITGGTGQVGHELARQDWGQDVTLHLPDRTELDISSTASVTSYFSQRTFAAVINPAAYTAVDKAEDDSAAAFLSNAQGPANLAEATRKAGIPLVHVSTDYVFAGDKTGPYDETDSVAPLGIYGASKLAGEIAVRAGNSRSVVMRTAWVLSAHRGNFLKTMLRVATANPQLRVVDDQVGCPTAASDIAQALKTITLRMIADEHAPAGIYHFVNAGEVSWCGLAREIFAMSKARGGPDADVLAITTTEYPTPARRPANSRLATQKISADYGINPRPWESAVSEIITELTATVPQTAEV